MGQGIEIFSVAMEKVINESKIFPQARGLLLRNLRRSHYPYATEHGEIPDLLTEIRSITDINPDLLIARIHDELSAIEKNLKPIIIGFEIEADNDLLEKKGKKIAETILSAARLMKAAVSETKVRELDQGNQPSLKIKILYDRFRGFDLIRIPPPIQWTLEPRKNVAKGDQS